MNGCITSKHDLIRDKLNNNEDFYSNVSRASAVFSLLGDVNRMKILLALMEGELCVYHICEIIGLKQSATSQHLRKLKDNNIVKCKKESNQVVYSIYDDHVKTIINAVLEHFNCK